MHTQISCFTVLFRCLQMAEITDPADVESRLDKARRVVDSRLLTQDEFKQIEARQLSKQMSVDKRIGHAAKRSHPASDDALHQEFVFHSAVLNRQLAPDTNEYLKF